ncbi:3'-5' exonuclease [Enterovirga sp.]|uniref:3'-5' exonuclease n=1 Tax=Enterovirga sp. TaxID=2026350 RepID=UPI0026328E9E|nr:3'-5' exonuclease [Enterovirga sp.]MDB5592321.1 Exonuclease RNase and polymerase [Enterovirga sp.]
MRAVAIDFETANEQRTSPCAVGLAWIEDGRVTRRAYSLVRPPEIRFEPSNVRIHGIRPEHVAGAPELPDAIAPFLDDLVGATVIAHNAAFDIAVLCSTLALYGLPVPRLSYLCTRIMARRAWPHERRFGLAAMAAKVGVSFAHHHAEEDAYACARVALAAASAAGTTRIGEAALRLQVVPGSVEGPLRTPCISAARERREIRVAAKRTAPPPSGRLAFTMRGSRGDAYEIAGAFEGPRYALRCSCMAGRHRIRCRHVTALLDGDVTDLLSGNLYDIEKLRAVLQALGEGALLPAESAARAVSDQRRPEPDATSPPISAAKAAASAADTRLGWISV